MHLLCFGVVWQLVTVMTQKGVTRETGALLGDKQLAKGETKWDSEGKSNRRDNINDWTAADRTDRHFYSMSDKGTTRNRCGLVGPRRGSGEHER